MVSCRKEKERIYVYHKSKTNPTKGMKQEDVSHVTLKQELKNYRKRGIQLELEGEKIGRAHV